MAHTLHLNLPDETHHIQLSSLKAVIITQGGDLYLHTKVNYIGPLTNNKILSFQKQAFEDYGVNVFHCVEPQKSLVDKHA